MVFLSLVQTVNNNFQSKDVTLGLSVFGEALLKGSLELETSINTLGK